MAEPWDELLRRAAAAQRLLMERALAKLGLTATQFAVLELLDARPGSSGAELARREQLTPATLSVVVANLERKAAIARSQDPANGRIQRLGLTPLGRDLLRHGRAATVRPRARLSPNARDGVDREIERWLRRIAEPPV